MICIPDELEIGAEDAWMFRILLKFTTDDEFPRCRVTESMTTMISSNRDTFGDTLAENEMALLRSYPEKGSFPHYNSIYEAD
jgi:hypothetical protein